MCSSLVIDFIHQIEALSKTKVILMRSSYDLWEQSKCLPELSPTLVLRVSIQLLSFQSQGHGDSTAQMPTCQGWSFTDLEYIRIRALRDTSTIHICRLYSTSMTLLTAGFIHKYQSVRGMWPPQTSSCNLKEHSASLGSRYTTQST